MSTNVWRLLRCAGFGALVKEAIEGNVESPGRVATVILKRFIGRLVVRMWDRLNCLMVAILGGLVYSLC
jgi:hypothetical protein